MSTARKDSWAGELLADEAAEIFEAWRRYKGPWEKFAEWIATTYPNARKPSRTALYAWANADCEHPGAGFTAWRTVRSARIHNAGEQMAQWARSLGDVADEEVAAGFKALGCDAMSIGDQKLAAQMMDGYCKITDRLLHRKELSLKERAQSTKDEQLKLAREKFEAAEKRLAAVQEAVKTAKANGGGLTDETLRKIEEAAGLL